MKFDRGYVVFCRGWVTAFSVTHSLVGIYRGCREYRLEGSRFKVLDVEVQGRIEGGSLQ